MHGDVTDSCQDSEPTRRRKSPTNSMVIIAPLPLLLSKDFKALAFKANVGEITKHFPNIQSSVTALKR